MTSSFRKLIAGLALPALVAAVALGPQAAATAQSLFEPVIKVNDLAITQYEINQRARMLELFRAPGNPETLARKQLIEDRLKLDAARAAGIVLDDAAIDAGVEEFAGRADMDGETFVRRLGKAGVEEESFRQFVRVGLVWRELSRAKFMPLISVSEDDLDRAEAALTGSSTVRVLLSEIIMPKSRDDAEAVQKRAAEIAEITSIAAFAEAARRYSASRTAKNGGRLDWTPLTKLPPQLRPIILGLAPGDVSEPLPLEGAVALFQLRDIREAEAPAPGYSAIEYAAYYIAGGRSEAALARAAEVEAGTDTCDDLYGIAKDEPADVLERGSKAPGEIPQDIAIELAKLDPGEVSTNLTRAEGRTLVFLMLCGRAPKLEGEDTSTEDLANIVRSRRLESFAENYLEQLRAEARIVELK